MDKKLLDDTLLDLLRMPEAARTPEIIASHLALAATAAGIAHQGAAPLQLEHMKLHSAVSLLAASLGGSFTHRTNLRLGDGLEGMELFASIETTNLGGVRFTGFGDTAERVLAQLRTAINSHGQQAAHKANRPRERGNRDPLRMLQRKASA